MKRKQMLFLLASVLLSGCATKQGAIIVTTPADAKGAARFCAVAAYQPPIDGDPVETQAQKARNNEAGVFLKCPWAKGQVAY